MNLPEMAHHSSASPEQSDADRPLGAEDKDLTDVAALRRELETVRERAAEAGRAVNFLHALIHQLPVAVKLETDDGKILFANELETELSGDANVRFEAGQTSAPDGQPMASAGGEPAPAVTTAERVVGPGGERTVLQIRKPARVGDTSLQVSASFDITERKRVENELSKRAYFDDLTGLPNRLRFSTSTISSTSTTITPMRSATRCSSRWRSAFPRTPGQPTFWRASAVTNSCW
jgi:PAS domain-containing protein